MIGSTILLKPIPTLLIQASEPQLSVELVYGQVRVILTHDGLCNLPNLQHVVFGCAGDKPRVILVPAEVGEMVGVATMHKEPVYA